MNKIVDLTKITPVTVNVVQQTESMDSSQDDFESPQLVGVTIRTDKVTVDHPQDLTQQTITVTSIVRSRR